MRPELKLKYRTPEELADSRSMTYKKESQETGCPGPLLLQTLRNAPVALSFTSPMFCNVR